MLIIRRTCVVALDFNLLWIIVVIETFDKHYYDEDNIKVNKASGGYKVSAPISAPVPKVELTEEDKKKAREEAIKRLTEEQYASLKKKPNKKKHEDVQQMSLF
nr:MAG TPA: PcfK-like protein [Siphoviridae sp. ct8TV20]